MCVVSCIHLDPWYFPLQIPASTDEVHRPTWLDIELSGPLRPARCRENGSLSSVSGHFLQYLIAISLRHELIFNTLTKYHLICQTTMCLVSSLGCLVMTGTTARKNPSSLIWGMISVRFDQRDSLLSWSVSVRGHSNRVWRIVRRCLLTVSR